MKISRKYLEDKGCFKAGHPYLVQAMIDAMPDDVPVGLSTTTVLNSLSHLVSSFRNLLRFNTESKSVKTYVPTNMFTFALAPSGVSKDRTKNTALGMLAGGYKFIEDMVTSDNIEKAKMIAIKEDGDEANYGKHLRAPLSLYIKFGTTQGVNQAISNIANHQNVGVPIISSSEIGSDLSNRRDSVTNNFTTLADLYDLGTVEFDTVRTQDAKIKGVESLPINFLVFGSEQGILLDNAVRRAFKSIFSQQLARRCMFFFTDEVIQTELPDNIEDRLALAEKVNKLKGKKQDIVHTAISTMCASMPVGQLITIDPEVDKVFNEYLNYNKKKAETIHPSLPITKLSRQHKQWLALKLAGVYAMLDDPKALTVTVEHYVAAINTVESLAHYLPRFEKELNKEPYEILHDHCLKNTPDGGSLRISFHELKKLHFVEGQGVKGKVKELIEVLNSYSKHLFTIDGTDLLFERAIELEQVGVSVIEIDTAPIVKATVDGRPKREISAIKAKVLSRTVFGYDYMEATFEEYANLLRGTYVYSPFRFKTKEEGAIYNDKKHPNPFGGIRGKDNIVGGCNFIVLDIDSSTITVEEAHFLLDGLNHHIATTANPNNQFKFRVLIELDTVVTTDAITWKYFTVEVGKHLGLTIDVSAQAQVFTTYATEDVKSVVDGEALEVKPLLLKAIEIKDSKPVKVLNTKAKNEALANKFETFRNAFECGEGNRNKAFIKLVYDARDLGASKEYTIELLKEVNDYIVDSMSEEDLQTYLISQVERW